MFYNSNWFAPADAIREHHSDFNQDVVLWPSDTGGYYCQIICCDTGKVSWEKFYSREELAEFKYESDVVAVKQRAVWDSGMAW